MNQVIIGHYHFPGSPVSIVYTEDTKTYEKNVYNVKYEETSEFIDKLKTEYPNYKVCEFVY